MFSTRSSIETVCQDLEEIGNNEEIVFVRGISTPNPVENSEITKNLAKNEEWSIRNAVYQVFRQVLEQPPVKLKVRGLKIKNKEFISGHLCKNDDDLKISLESFDLSTDATKKRRKKKKIGSIRKKVRRFFRNFRFFFKNPCDDRVCPGYCECREVKSFLNKKFEVEEELKDADERSNQSMSFSLFKIGRA